MKLSWRREAGAHDLYCDGSCERKAVPPGLAGAAQLQADVIKSCGDVAFLLYHSSSLKSSNHNGQAKSALYTIMPLKVILLSLFPVWKWARGQLSFKAKEIECASCDAENC